MRNVFQQPVRPFRSCLWTSLAVASLCAASFGPAWCRDQALDSYLHEVESSYRGVKTWKAEFTQTYRVGDRVRREAGRVLVVRGGKMRWDYSSPDPKLFLADGKTTLLYIPGEKHLMRSREKTSEDFRAPFALLLSRLNLRRAFGKIEDAGAAGAQEPGDRVLRCFPKDADEGYDAVLIEFSPSMDLRRLLIRYPDGSTMEFTFARIERNVAAPASLFRFVPPAGTEVIDEGAGQ